MVRATKDAKASEARVRVLDCGDLCELPPAAITGHKFFTGCVGFVLCVVFVRCVCAGVFVPCLCVELPTAVLSEGTNPDRVCCLCGCFV